jgi:predicted DNA-binding mobile mystery protein A
MNLKSVVTRQYQAIVDQAAKAIPQEDQGPPEGWLATARKALGMSGSQVARRLGVTRSRISQAEQSELSGGATLKTMHSIAEAMGCRFVYAVVPVGGNVEDLVKRQALRKAQAIVQKAGTHMALELQSLSDDKNRDEVERIANELMRTMPSNFWTNA